MNIWLSTTVCSVSGSCFSLSQVPPFCRRQPPVFIQVQGLIICFGADARHSRSRELGSGATIQLDPAQGPGPDSLHLSSVFHATSKQVLCVLIHEVDVAAFHAARQKHAVSVFYHLRESVAGPLHDSVKGLGLVSLPFRNLGYVD
jgi:hypothetical protein